MLTLVITALVGISLPSDAQDIANLKQQRPYDHSGSLSLQGGPYLYSGDGQPRNQPWFWNANGQFTMRIYGWDLPFSFSLGSQERRYTQPFNRYGVSPHYKWIKLHAGYRSMRFNPYTLGGLQFLGGGVELDPKGFRFGAFYGRFSKPVAQDTLASITPIPAYERTGFGMKIGLGTARNFVDVMIVKVVDDPASIPDVTGGRVAPMENLVAGVSGRVSFTRKLFGQFDAAASALTPDRLAPVTDASDVPEFANGLFRERIGTKALFAGSAGITWNDKILSLKLTAKQVDPGYRSLAAVFQQTDVRAFTIEPTLRLLNSKVRLSGSVGRQFDNVRDQRISTSVRTIGSANLSWNPSRSYGMDVNYANYGIQQQAGLQVVNDTFRVAIANRSYGMTHRVVRANNTRVFSIVLTAGLQELQDLNPFGTFAASENQVIYGNLNLMRVRNRDNLSFTGGLNYSRNTAVMNTSVLIGPLIGASIQFAKQKATASFNVAYNNALQNDRPAGTTLNGNCNLQYRASTSHRFSLSITALNNQTSFAASRQFTEIRFLGGYTYMLHPRKRT